MEPNIDLTTESRKKVILNTFRLHFGGNGAMTLVRAPGRVNLIGEHTDYNGYPVLPIAIDRDILIAFTPREDGFMDLVNCDEQFGRRTFRVEEYDRPFAPGDWGNYVKAAMRGLAEHSIFDPRSFKGLNAVYWGNVPESAGLSSSSALVVATALALLHHGVSGHDRACLAEILAAAERYAGLEGGGMDQAISLHGERGHALKIDFFPLRMRRVPIPEGYSFVVCNSLIRAPKTASAKYLYNRRVVECRLAMAMLAHALAPDPAPKRLADLSARALNRTEGDMMLLADRILPPHSVSAGYVASLLGIDEDRLLADYCTMKDGTVLEEPSDGFHVRKRYRHVVTEASRVDASVQALEEGEMKHFGRLMNESHRSCRDDYEVSCPELEVLTTLARGRGALGSRLTGAGFGGCTVSLLRDEQVPAFLAGMREDYYIRYTAGRPEAPFIPYRSIDDVLFVSHPAEGASTGPLLI